MPSVNVYDTNKNEVGKIELSEEIFGLNAKEKEMEADEVETRRNRLFYEAVRYQMAKRRAGTHSTKTRAEVRGGGAKPWRQKGTGRARAGSSRMPNWRGGGIAHGPKPRDYSQKTPKKMVKLALRSALSDRASDGNVIVVESWSFESPKTKDAIAALSAVGAEGKILVVLGDGDDTAWKSFRNLTDVHCLHVGELNTYDVLNNDVVVFTAATLPTGADASKADDEDAVAAPVASDEEE